MNRLIIIGNGFDLAHGMSTSYASFLKNYLIKAINVFRGEKYYDDELMSISLRYNININTSEIINEDNVLDYFKNLKNLNSVIVGFKSSVLEKSLEEIEKIMWVDIEEIFFQELKRLANNQPYNSRNVILLNDQLEYLKKLLSEYLCGIEDADISKVKQEYIKYFFELPQYDIIKNGKVRKKPIESYTFLNFNYTNTIAKYKNELDPNLNIQFFNIHGQLEEGELIFGYGDEYSKDFLELKEKRKREISQNIKSYKYLANSSYRKLMMFLDSGFYQVYVFGHSLGISDRTMLKEVFDSENCLSIKLFYYQFEDGNDFDEKIFNSSYHFEKSNAFRDKIIPFSDSVAMPQSR